MSGRPRFGVAVHKGDVSSGADGIAAALEKPLIFILAVDDAGGPIILDEGDRKELALGLSDEVVEFGFHCRGHDVIVFGFQFFVEKKFLNGGNDDESDADGGEGEDDVFDGEHLVWLVCWLRGELRRVRGVCQHDF